MKKIMSFILAIGIMSQLVTMSLFADRYSMNVQTVSQNSETTEQVFCLGNNTFYMQSTPDFSYCSEMTPDGKIQFSYFKGGSLFTSEVYSVDQILGNNKRNYSVESTNINEVIINNLSEFNNVTNLGGDSQIEPRSYSTLQSAAKGVFGADYANKLIDSTTKTYNGNKYTVRCQESQRTTTELYGTKQFAKDVASTAVLSWVTAGNWTWKGVVSSIVKSVVTTGVKNGITVITSGFTAQKATGTADRTRLVGVGSSSKTQYSAGWTRKVRFFKGSLGWTNDSSPYYDFKQGDYDDVSSLIDRGFSNFIREY